MRFAFRMAVRELRASWKRLLLFFACLALGVGGIVLLRSVVQDVRAGVSREARSMIAADVVISTSRPWDERTRRLIEQRVAEAHPLARTEALETSTMVRPAEDRPVARMAEVKGVGNAFPLYGKIEIRGGAPYSYALVRGHGALVRPELLVQLNLRVGDAILIGQERFTVRGVVLSEPGRRLGAFSFGPRVLVAAEDLERAGLTGWGSRVNRQILLALPEGTAAGFAGRLRDELGGRFVNVRSWASTGDHVGEDLARAENYLSLVGLVVLILGGVGVSSVTQVFMRQKVRTVAILKCLGATSRQLFAAYLTQALVLGLAGCVLGVALAALGIEALPLLFDRELVNAFPHGLTRSAVAQGVSVGLLVSLLFSVVPLLDVRRVKPSLLLRSASLGGGPRDWAKWGAIGVVLVTLVALAVWQAASVRVGLALSVALAGVTLALHLVGMGLTRVIRPVAGVRLVAVRHSVLRLTRPGNQTRAILLAVGLGAFFIVGVRLLQANLLREFSVAIDTHGADMFLIDVQRGQANDMRAFLDSHGSPGVVLIPVLRARVIAVRGRETNLDSYEDVRGRGELGREFTVTWRDHLAPNERIAEGRFWPAGTSGSAEVSIERSLRDRFRIRVGDRMRFDVAGREVSATVSSVRDVDFRDARQGGFMFVFRPGLLDRAPTTWIAAVRGPGDAMARARFQRDLVDRFPNVSVIDLREVLDLVGQILSKVTLGVTAVGALVLLTGILILVGSVSMTRFQRVYETAVFRTLGAGSRLLLLMTACEYFLLGLLAGVIGSVAAVALSWYATSHILTLRWLAYPGIVGAGILLTALLVTAVGVAASADTLRRRPLAALRAE